MTIRVGVNGFGRIGRNFFRAVRQQGADVEIVAANDLGDVPTMAHLLKYDSVMPTLGAEVEATGDGIEVDGKLIKITAVRDPKELPWGELGVDVVVESTGIFTTRDKAAAHLDAGAPFVIVSAPCTNADATFVVGVNDDTFDPSKDKVVSNASCTTNCFVPMIKVLDDAFGVQQGLMTTVHAYTGDQSLVDGPHKDLRRARAAAASSGPLSNVLVYSDEPIVSSDIVGSPASCTFDSGLTMSQGNLVKIMGWYDNEWGYSNRLVDLVQIVGAANR
jgi:glyceraldehyde 3-phosphate dehydrogenase